MKVVSVQTTCTLVGQLTVHIYDTDQMVFGIHRRANKQCAHPGAKLWGGEGEAAEG